MKKIIIFLSLFSIVNISYSAIIDSNSKNQIQTLQSQVDSIKIIVKSIQNQTLNYSHKSTEELIIDKVQSFYDSAWTKLMFFIAIIGGIIGFLAPYLLNRFQKNEYSKNLTDFKNFTLEKIDESNKEIFAKTKETIIKELQKSKEELNKEILSNKAMSFYLQGMHLFDKNKINSLKSFIDSLSYQFYSGKIKNTTLIVDKIIQVYKLIPEAELPIKMKKRISIMIEKMETKKDNELYTEIIEKMKKEIY